MSDFSPSMQDGYKISDGPLYGMEKPKAYQFNITNMDDASQKVVELNRYTSDGLEVIKNLDANITNLYQCWRGSDAYTNIFYLSEVRDHCKVLVKIALEFSIQAYNEIKGIQETVQANGGKAVSIGSLTILEADIPSVHVRNPDTTAELFVDTVAARNEITSLKNTQALFIDFSNKIKQGWDFMLEIWKAGWRRDSLLYGIDTFKSNLKTYNDNFEQTIKALEKAIQTWES